MDSPLQSVTLSFVWSLQASVFFLRKQGGKTICPGCNVSERNNCVEVGTMRQEN